MKHLLTDLPTRLETARTAITKANNLDRETKRQARKALADFEDITYVLLGSETSVNLVEKMFENLTYVEALELLKEVKRVVERNGFYVEGEWFVSSGQECSLWA